MSFMLFETLLFKTKFEFLHCIKNKKSINYFINFLVVIYNSVIVSTELYSWVTLKIPNLISNLF